MPHCRAKIGDGQTVSSDIVRDMGFVWHVATWHLR